jgi:serine protease Do
VKMLSRLLFPGLVVLCVFALPWKGTGAAELADRIQRVKRSVVGVGTVQPSRRPPGQFVGTGFVVDDGRHVTG